MPPSNPTGYDANPAEIQDLLSNLITESDPLTRYTLLCAQQATHLALVSAIATERGRALWQMMQQGASYKQIATDTGLGSKQRVAQIMALRHRRIPPSSSPQTKPPPPAKSPQHLQEL